MRRFAAIPAHPQKQYTRRWRLYHFCGIYYPIREVIPIAIYHWNIGIVSRGKGKSAVAAAAYRSGEKLTNEWDGMTHDYTRKGGVVHTEIMLPPHAPPSFSDRATLWNSVELYEKAGNAQLAREIDAALPIELSREEQIRLVREYCSSQFVSKGMCVDFAIHDTDSGNPHCHIMLTMRPLDERGAWAAKSKKEYDLDENGEVCCVHATYDPETFGGDSPDGRKVKGTIHWVSAKENVPCEIRLYERLFNVPNPSDEEGVSSFEDNLNPDSLTIAQGYVEKALGNCEVGAKYQFMRNGYFCKDKDSTDEKPVFNRTVALRDSFKITK